MAVKQLMYLFLCIALATIFAYLLFAVKALMLLSDARAIYSQFQRDGLSPSIRQQIEITLPAVDHFIQNIESPLFSPVIAIADKEEQLASAIAGYQYLRPALTALPDVVGLEDSKRYLVAFQNNAEARGTGGIIGAFAVVTVESGKAKVEKVGTNAILQSLQEIPIPMPEEYIRLYRSDPAIWQNSNLSPHFPYGAQIWLALWQRQFQEKLDGVITLDPIVLQSLLALTGPVQVRNREISHINVVAETLSDSYLRFEDDNLGRKQYLVEIIDAVANALQSRQIRPMEAIRQLVAPLLQHRILIYSTNPQTQKTLELSPVSGAMSTQPSNEFRLVIQNTAGNKMDYYIDRSLQLTSKSCRVKRMTEAQFTITNSASRDTYLPAYVKGRLDLDMPAGKENSTAVTLLLYGPPQSNLVSAMTVDSGTSAGYTKTERTRPILVIPVELAAGESKSFVADFQGGFGSITSHEQPLVRSQKTTINDRCAA